MSPFPFPSPHFSWQVFGSSGGNTSGPEALVVWQLIGAGVSMVVAPMAYSCKVRVLTLRVCLNLSEALEPQGVEPQCRALFLLP